MSNYNLGLDLTFSTPAFNLPAAAAAMPSLPSTSAFTMPTFGSSLLPASHSHYTLSSPPTTTTTPGPFHASGEPQSSGFGVITDLAKVLIKDELPTKVQSAAKNIGVVAGAALTAKKIVDQSEQAIANGQTPEEAYACQAANVLANAASSSAMTNAITSGIIPYLEAAIAFPPLALTIPAVGTVLPVAYQGAETAAHYIGNGAENTCHFMFDQARKLSNGGN